MRSLRGTVYLLHFACPSKHERYYLGLAEDLEACLVAHRKRQELEDSDFVKECDTCGDRRRTVDRRGAVHDGRVRKTPEYFSDTIRDGIHSVIEGILGSHIVARVICGKVNNF